MSRGRSSRTHSPRPQEFVYAEEDIEDDADAANGVLGVAEPVRNLPPLLSAAERVSVPALHDHLRARRGCAPPLTEEQRRALDADDIQMLRRALCTALDDRDAEACRAVTTLHSGTTLVFSSDEEERSHWDNVRFLAYAGPHVAAADGWAKRTKAARAGLTIRLAENPIPRQADDPTLLLAASSPFLTEDAVQQIRSLVRGRRAPLGTEDGSWLERPLRPWEVDMEDNGRSKVCIHSLTALRRVLALAASVPEDELSRSERRGRLGRRMEFPVGQDVFAEWVRTMSDQPGWRGVYLGYTEDTYGPQYYEGSTLRARAVADLLIDGVHLRAHVLTALKENTAVKAPARMRGEYRRMFPDLGDATPVPMDGYRHRPYMGWEWMSHQDLEGFPRVEDAPPYPVDGWASQPCSHTHLTYETDILGRGVVRGHCMECLTYDVVVHSVCQVPSLRASIPSRTQEMELACESISAVDRGEAPPASWGQLCARLPEATPWSTKAGHTGWRRDAEDVGSILFGDES